MLKMKKFISITLASAMTLTMGCSAPKQTEAPKVESARYTAYGRYYTNDTVITNDGNEWGYGTDTISNKAVYDGMPVWIGFDDNGTPDDIYDDTILGLVYDRETAIYDDLETSLGDSFELKRDGNNIRIMTLERND
jgi:hypothetical protein